MQSHGPVCQICQKLHSLGPEETKSYPDLEHWFTKDQETGQDNCLTGSHLPWSKYGAASGSISSWSILYVITGVAYLLILVGLWIAINLSLIHI